MAQNNHKITIKDELTEFLLYTAPNGKVKVEIYFHDENIWLTQDKIALLFGVQRPAITKHLKNIFESGELVEDRVSSILEHTTKHGALKGKTQIQSVKFYNLDAIISVGYRVNSIEATQFRIWATERLKEYIIKGFAMDDERLKNGKYFGKDYFLELLERVRSIRASERKIYQQITDIFAECSIDYNSKSDIAKNFYAMIQNKFHFAIAGKTAAEIIYETADKQKPFMGLKTWKNSPKGRILKSDTVIAKNYLNEDKIKKLERGIVGYFDYIERLIENHTALTMEKLAKSVNNFLEFNKYEVFEGKGTVSHAQAEQKAFQEYEEYNKTQTIESDFDRLVKSLPTGEK
ncbi:MAG: cell filamentation protein Fic [Candidatus Moranbacteria bacterium CG23_combo_of_CG06-09_8_20_14_all_35_22]|nr:MAG: cell filamentation protein Fic [Candidatus Moranbacteria bacterium CG23_combo_of_CG06-09_8_20_14_all_35_22]